MGRTVRIVNYAVNGSGVGHLTRLVAVNRWIRRYATHAGARAEIYFLTSSEADGLLFAERFASFKVPSKTVVDDAGIDKLTYLSLAKQWIWHSLGLLRPDLLIVDTFPRGSFGELLGALDLARRRAFIYRPVKESIAARPDFQAMLPLYDAILVPELDVEVPVPAEVRGRVRHTGPVLVRERVELRSRDEARRTLGIAEGRLAVWVSAGGGGDPGAERQLLEVHRLLGDDPSLHLVVGAGPLYRGRQLHGERVTWLGAGAAIELMSGIDLAIAAVGYNTFVELMFAGVPSIFLAQPKIADDQEARAGRAVAAGAAVLLADLAALPAAVATWKDDAARARAAAAARALVPVNHAREMAAELLRLVLPGAEVDAAERAVDDGLLSCAASLGLELDPFFDVMRLLEPPDDGGPPRQPERASELACELLSHIVERHIPVAAALRLAEQIARRLVGASTDERAAALRSLFECLESFGDWAGATTLMKIFSVEKQARGADFASELAIFLDGLRRRDEDLYQGITRLSRAQGAAGGADLPSNLELLRAAAASDVERSS